MKEFYIYPKGDEAIFFALCQLFEQTYHNFSKEELLVDPLDDELIQRFTYESKQAIIVLERLWFDEIILRANFEPVEFLELITPLQSEVTQ